MNKENKIKLRDYWYSLQDIAELPEAKRVELERLVKSIIQDLEKNIEVEVEELREVNSNEAVSYAFQKWGGAGVSGADDALLDVLSLITSKHV